MRHSSLPAKQRCAFFLDEMPRYEQQLQDLEYASHKCSLVRSASCCAFRMYIQASTS